MIPDSGLTITFNAGAYVKGDYYLFICSAPQYSTGLFAALNGLLSDPREWRFVRIVGYARDAPGCAAIAAVVDSVMSQAERNARYCRAFIEGPRRCRPVSRIPWLPKRMAIFHTRYGPADIMAKKHALVERRLEGIKRAEASALLVGCGDED